MFEEDFELAFMSRKKTLCWHKVMKRIPIGTILTGCNNPKLLTRELDEVLAFHFHPKSREG